MALKQRINKALVDLTGYRIQRATTPVAAPPKPKPKPKSKPAAKPKPKGLPKDYDAESRAIIKAVKPYTMTDADKVFALIQATRYVSRHRIPGDIVECGVWRGGSMQAAARALIAAGDTERDLYLFDTYEGMPPPSAEDVRHDGKPAQSLLENNDYETSKVWAVATLDDVQEGFAKVPYPEDKVHFVKGLVEDTIPEAAPAQIAILRLDTDWYESTRHELEHLYPRLSSGGVLLLDDYGFWQGARQAVDEFLEATGERLLLTRMASGRMAVKP
jgi:O-methyltransferase